MIQMIRVDYRLLHGQVAVSWTSALGADCILLVSDTVLNDKLRLQALSLAKPEGCKVVVKNTEDAVEFNRYERDHDNFGGFQPMRSIVTDKYKLFVVCETIQQAGAVAKAMGVKKINLGNVAFSEDARQVSTSVFLTPENEAYVKELLGEGYELFIQMIPADAKTDAAKVIG